MRVYEQVEAELTNNRNKEHAKSYSTPLARDKVPIHELPLVSSGIKQQYAPSLPVNPTKHGNNYSGSIQDDSFRHLMEIQDRQNHVLYQLIQQQQQGMMALTLPQPSLYSTDRRYPSNANAKHAHVFCVNAFSKTR